ncbi:MAG: glycosyltransferase family 2 protein, partial [Burkholderia vietnamiensis]|nr:glycosyltransferase family 2 protein [Burkholderia vietnamiensis]
MNMRDTQRAPVVSVVVPTYRRPDLLERLRAQRVEAAFDPTAYEIVVDHDDPAGSARAVVDACRARVSDVPVIRYMSAPD